MKPWESSVKNACLSLGLLALLPVAAVPSGFAQTNATSTPAPASSSQHVQLEGELEVLNKDFKDHAEVSYSLKLANGNRLPMKFTGDAPKGFVTGDHVQAEGELSSNTLLLYSGSNVKSGGNGGTPPTTSTSIPLPNTFGPQSTLVILVNFQDSAVEPWTPASVQTMFSGTVNNFIKENSYGQTSIVPTVVGWYTIPDSITTCNTSQMATDAQNAAVAGGVVLSNYARYVYVFPFDSACAFAGSSTVGGKPSESWINGGGSDFHTMDHELGHAFGLWHSHTLDCGTSATICSGGTVIDYGDLMDTMGTTADWSPDYNSYQKERLGWLGYGSSPAIQTVASSGSYTISPYEPGGSGPNALKILQSTDSTTGAKTWYYLEARQPLGFDAFLTATTFPYNQTVSDSVLFHLGTDGNGNSGDLIDMTPATPVAQQWWDMGLGVGQTYNDSSAGVSVTVASVSSSGATVQVTLKGSAAPSQVTTSVTTNQSSYMPGQTVGITVTATSGSVPASGVAVTATVTNPSGNATTLKGTTGSNGTASLSYNLSKRATAGTYQVGAAAASATASATAAPSVSFSVQ